MDTFKVAGLQYHQKMENLVSMDEGDLVELIPDPENKFDENAIKILHPTLGMIGFVPKNINQAVGALIRNGDIVARVEEVDVDAEPWSAITLTLVPQNKEETE